MNSSQFVLVDLQKAANADKAKLLAGFFKTGPGQYGAGDQFLGVMVPQQRAIAKKYCALALSEIEKLIKNKFHEARLTGLLILVDQYETGNDERKKTKALDPGIRRDDIFNFYLAHTKQINNWDLVDLTAPKIVGGYLLNQPRRLLYKLIKSKNLWERRIAVLATFQFIKHNQFVDALKIAKLSLTDQHDLMHKAVGWMLREIGKRDVKVLAKFLDEHGKKMPRTMLRYAIERLPEEKRQHYLKK